MLSNIGTTHSVLNANISKPSRRQLGSGFLKCLSRHGPASVVHCRNGLFFWMRALDHLFYRKAGEREGPRGAWLNRKHINPGRVPGWMGTSCGTTKWLSKRPTASAWQCPPSQRRGPAAPPPRLAARECGSAVAARWRRPRWVC